MNNWNKEQHSIGGFRPENPFFLAPLAGISDAPMRRICGSMGASLTYTEMVSAKGLYYGDKRTDRLLRILPEEKPVAIQIFGHEPDIIAFAAKELDDRPNVTLDINMGCPVPKVVKNGEGSALMKDPALAASLVRAAVENTRKPVTAKIRAGFTNDHINAVEVAQALEEAGASAVAVHARTREQYYSGEADWDVIAAVKQAVHIPVIGNGDVTSPETASEMMRQTGCDFVMIGRAALGNPWIFRELKNAWEGLPEPPAPTLEDKKEMMQLQLNELIAEKGEYVAVREMRKVCGWYLKGIPGGARLRNEINQITEVSRLRERIDSI